MKRSTHLLTLVVAGAIFGTGGAFFGWYSGVHADAISRDNAIEIALRETGPAQVRYARLVRVDGKPVWNAELIQPGQGGVTEVRVQAMTGELLGVRHESDKKADEELSKLAKQLGITAAHVLPKEIKTVPVSVPPFSTKEGQRK